MHFQLGAVLLFLTISSAHASELRCEFLLRPFGRYHYECMGQTEISASDYSIGSVIGQHKSGFSSNDVMSVEVYNKSSVTVMPTNLKVWFQNFVQFKIYDLPNFPGFKAEDFTELTHLKSFVTSKLPLVTDIPGNAFMFLTNLEVLGLNEMPNLENFDADLLIYATKLEIFSARGPNKINQISPRFFRSQEDTLQAVDFTNTKLLKISHNVFANFKVLTDAFFKNSGCLDVNYNYGDVKENLSEVISNQCENISN